MGFIFTPGAHVDVFVGEGVDSFDGAYFVLVDAFVDAAVLIGDHFVWCFEVALLEQPD